MNSVRNSEPAADAVPAVATAYRILETLASMRPDGATLTELAGVLRLSKSTMHGQLTTLCAYGLVERDDVTRRFGLGHALVRLGRAACPVHDLGAAAAQALPTLAGEHHLTFVLARVERPHEAVLTERAYPRQAVHVGVSLGNSYSVFDGAIGKCLLAAMAPEVARRAALAKSMPLHTDRTIRDPEELLAAAATVRGRGWATSAGELKENHAVAAPLHESDGTFAYVLCALGFPSDIPVTRFTQLGEVMREACRAIEVSAAGRPQAESPDA